MSTLELVLRIAASAQLALVLLLLATRREDHKVYGYTSLLLLGIAGYLLAPLVLFHWHWGIFAVPIILLATLVPVFFWYFACAVFLDRFEPPGWIHALAVATALLGMLAFCSTNRPDFPCAINGSNWPDWISQLSKLAWVITAFAVILRGAKVDLVESRRRFRLLVVALGGIYILGVLLVEPFITDTTLVVIEQFHISAIFIAISALACHLLAVDPRNVFAQIASRPPAPGGDSTPLAGELLALMEKERAYARDGLTVDSLAAMLRTQPHVLRRVINGDLGHRNFSTFVNGYRVQEVAKRLGQDQYRDTPLLTLALDSGFRSLAPFNRYFKEYFGVTPSQYRKQHKA
jgi:AraC-like DNA-binding protein